MQQSNHSKQAQEMLARVRKSLDALVSIARDYNGLMPSIIDRSTNQLIVDPPEPIAGQRPGDRTIRGSNLMHDQPTLVTLYALGHLEPSYTQAADDYLRYFATHCTRTPTGLFPWGEHTYWDIVDDCPGNSYVASDNRPNNQHTHDHLRACPLWLWEKLQQFNPDCVQRFAHGLTNHWIPADEKFPLEYNRHAYLLRNEIFAGGHLENAPDFPRHGGFYIFDWSFAYAKKQDQAHLANIKTMLDYWWEKRDEDGLLYIESRSVPGSDFDHNCAVAQTLSLASSMLEAANLLDKLEPELASTMRQRAAVYIDAHFAAPHDLAQRKFLHLWHKTVPSRTRAAMIWGSSYGKTPVSYSACNNLCIYRLTGDQRALEWAAAAGQGYLEEPFPQGVQVPAMDAGMGLGLLADLHEITGEDKWIEGGLKLAEKVIPIYFEDDKPLPRGAANIDWYESQMGPGFILHGLARVAMLSQQREHCPLAADYTGR